MEKDIIDVMMDKQYFELSSSEKEELAQYCSNEDEYNHLREVMIGVESIKFDSYTPKSETKQKLDDLFDQTYPKASPVWYMSVLGVVVPKEKPIHRQPLVQIAAIALLVLLAVPLFNTDITQEKKNQVAMVEKEEQAVKQDKVEQAVPKSNEQTQMVDEEQPTFVTDAEGDNFAANAGATPEVMTRSSEPVIDMTPLSASSTIATGAPFTTTGFDHPDGVFDASSALASSEVSYSVSAADEPDVLDLLTATF